MSSVDLSGELAQEVAAWSDHAEASPIYRYLTSEVAKDQEVLSILSEIKGVPKVNVFLAAIHLLVGSDDALAAWYPSKTPDPIPIDPRLYEVFKGFVVERQAEIIELGAKKMTQTNEVGRCAVLVPFFPNDQEMVHVIELGSAAGLNLCFDRFGYHYSTGERLGTGTPTLDCQNEAGVTIPSNLAEVGVRVGVDVHPIDLSDRAERSWLEALIWPDQRTRRMRFLEAAAIRRTVHIRTISGDAVDALPEAVSLIPGDGHLLIFHSMMFASFDQAHKERLDEAIREVADGRSITRIGLEVWDDRGVAVRRGDGKGEMEHVVIADSHGAWMRI